MNHKRNLFALLLLLLGTESMIWSANSNHVVPLFSPKQLKIGMKNFKNYLDKVKRCIATGPCKAEELMQVKKHGLFLLKAIVLAALAGFAIRKGRQVVREAPERIERGIGWFTRVSKKALLEQTLGILEEPAPPTTEEEREIKRLKDEIAVALKKRFREGTAFTQEEFVVFFDSALQKEYGPETERTARIKENLRVRFRDMLEGMTREIKALIVEFGKYLGSLLLEIDKEETERLLGDMSRRLSALAKEHVVAVFQDEEIRTKLSEFLNKVGEEVDLVGFIEQMLNKGVDIEYYAPRRTRLGAPIEAKLRVTGVPVAKPAAAAVAGVEEQVEEQEEEEPPEPEESESSEEEGKELQPMGE